jgi:hypothetical protein
MTRQRTARRAAAWILVALGCGAGALACGHYGPPVRAREYREKQEEKSRAEAQRQQGSTPESRNEPLPAPP